MLILLGFSVDIAHIQRVRAELRAAADLSAKAAAAELSRTQNLAKARSAAQSVAAANSIAGQSLTLQDTDIVYGKSTRQSDGTWSFQENITPFNSVRVNARRNSGSADGPIDLLFGQFYGRHHFDTQFTSASTFLDIDVCLVLDRSSSMKLSLSSTANGMSPSDWRFCLEPQSDSRWIALAGAVDLFFDQLRSTNASEQVALVTFASNYNSHCGDSNSESSIDEGLTTDISRVESAIDARSSTVWNGATDVAAGIDDGHDVLTGSGRSSVCHQGDGGVHRRSLHRR